MRAIFNHYRRLALDMILPPRCPVTGELVAENGTIHPRYWQKLHFIHAPHCRCCGLPFADISPDAQMDNNADIDTDNDTNTALYCSKCLEQKPLYHKARSVFRYDPVSAKMILKFKHADAVHMAPLFARWMQHSGAELLQESNLIVPVPLHRFRLLHRRYNQAALLARLLARQQNHLVYAPMALKRIRYTPSQGTKTYDERHQNMQAAFAVPKAARKLIDGKTVLLIDDVYTSGATIKACTEALLQNGAGKINVLTLARTGFAS